MLEPRASIVALIDLWRSLRRDGRPPVRADLDPQTLRPWLGWLTVFEQLDGGADLRPTVSEGRAFERPARNFGAPRMLRER